MERDKIMTVKGEDYLKTIWREANTIAPQLGLEKEAERLDAVIGTSIILTGDTSQREIEEAGLPNCTVVHKPADPDRLLSLIQSTLS